MPAAKEAVAPDAIRFSIAGELAEVRRAAETVRAFLQKEGCTGSEVLDCELALVEACNNAILYAGPTERERVEIEASCNTCEIELRITDHTDGFKWPRKAALPQPESETGRGVFLIQAVMNDTTYTQSSMGNTLVLRKSRSRPKTV